MDRSIVEEAGLEFYGIPAGKLRRNFSPKNASDLFRVLAGFFAARRILRRERPALLFSKGGFVSVPPCAAAFSLGITVFTHESDYSPGLATRINTRFAARGRGRIITAYPETAERFPPGIRERVLALGNPVRPGFKNANPCQGRIFLEAGEGDRILLVLGGSQGALELNRLVEAALEELTKLYLVIHQTGPSSGDIPAAPRYRPYCYINRELPGVLAAAELVLCRSGAGTIWECAAAGKPMILVPLAGSGTRGDQLENARFFERAGAALVLPPGGRGAAELLCAVRTLAEDGERRLAMAASSRRIGEADCGGLILRALLDALDRNENGGKP
jgi:UDP-N-acetylglucosamine--N-acetylmuramyl-(pentapeptide) pyrophosphoryl-undecaprenol N-acetylglucosamine transferase